MNNKRCWKTSRSSLRVCKSIALPLSGLGWPTGIFPQLFPPVNHAVVQNARFKISNRFTSIGTRRSKVPDHKQRWTAVLHRCADVKSQRVRVLWVTQHRTHTQVYLREATCRCSGCMHGRFFLSPLKDVENFPFLCVRVEVCPCTLRVCACVWCRLVQGGFVQMWRQMFIAASPPCCRLVTHDGTSYR